MATVVQINIKKPLTDLVKKCTTEAITPARLNPIAQQLRAKVITRTRLGRGVNPSTKKQQRLKKLSQSYKDFRAGKIAFFTKNRKVIPYVPDSPPPLDPTTSVAKSNLTATGQMLRAVRASARARFIRLTLKDSRGKDLSGKQSKIGNQELKDIVEAAGRTWFDITKDEANFIARLVRQNVLDCIKRRKKSLRRQKIVASRIRRALR